jgi:hypothetical protein
MAKKKKQLQETMQVDNLLRLGAIMEAGKNNTVNILFALFLLVLSIWFNLFSIIIIYLICNGITLIINTFRYINWKKQLWTKLKKN